MKWLAILGVVAGCTSGKPTGTGSAGSGGSAAIASPGSAAPVSAKALQDALLEAAGNNEVVFALDAKGELIARRADGTSTTVLLGGPYTTAYHDAARELIWLRRDTGFDVLDLRAPGPAVATTVIAAPEKVAANEADPITEPPRWDMTERVVIDVGTRCRGGAGLTFAWSKDGACTTTGSEKLKVVAKDWFAAQEHRAVHELTNFTRPIKQHHHVPAAQGTCKTDKKGEIGYLCGTGYELGALPYDLVITSANTEKCPTKQCRLYDRARKKYLPVPGVPADDPDAATCGPFLFDESGTSYLVGDQVCDSQLHCTSVGRQAIGWLGRDRVLDAND